MTAHIVYSVTIFTFRNLDNRFPNRKYLKCISHGQDSFVCTIFGIYRWAENNLMCDKLFTIQ